MDYEDPKVRDILDKVTNLRVEGKLLVERGNEKFKEADALMAKLVEDNDVG